MGRVFNVISFTLIRIAADHKKNDKPTTSTEFSPSLTWILFEEPEAFLHPTQIDMLNDSLRKLSIDATNQVTIVTHNPQFVSRNIEDLTSLVRIYKDGTVSTCKQVCSSQLQDILTTNQQELAVWKAAGIAVDNEDFCIDMECIKYCLWLNPFRCSAFFSNLVLLVEGPTESALIGNLLDNGQIPRPKSGVTVFDALGKYNIPRFMKLFSALGIRHSVLFDNDNGKHDCVKASILCAASPYTVAIDYFEKDIESFLNMTKASDPRRKPQHMMWSLKNGNIDLTKIDQLKEKIIQLIIK